MTRLVAASVGASPDGRLLLVEGEAGVGKTELAKVLSASLGARLIRLQCDEGLDVKTIPGGPNAPAPLVTNCMSAGSLGQPKTGTLVDQTGMLIVSAATVPAIGRP